MDIGHNKNFFKKNNLLNIKGVFGCKFQYYTFVLGVSPGNKINDIYTLPKFEGRPLLSTEDFF